MNDRNFEMFDSRWKAIVEKIKVDFKSYMGGETFYDPEILKTFFKSTGQNHFIEIASLLNDVDFRLPMAYQPQVDSQKGSHSSEALCAVDYPFYLFDAVSLMDDISGTTKFNEHVISRQIETICEDLNFIRGEKGLNDKNYSVGYNINPKHLTNDAMAKFMAVPDELKPFFTIELLESYSIKKDDSFIIRQIKTLKDMGFKISIDDFSFCKPNENDTAGYVGGTGENAYLSNPEITLQTLTDEHIFPDSIKFGVSQIKIDGIYSKNIASDQSRQAEFNRVISNIGRIIENKGITFNDISVIIEGVETKQDLEYLEKNYRELIPNMKIQGFYYSKKLRPKDLIAKTFEIHSELASANGLGE